MGEKYQRQKSGESYLPPLIGSKRTSLIVRFADRPLAGRGPVDRRLVFRARAADVRAPLSLYLAVGRLAVQGKGICPVRLDFVVYPSCLSLLLNQFSGFGRTSRLDLCNEIGFEGDSD